MNRALLFAGLAANCAFLAADRCTRAAERAERIPFIWRRRARLCALAAPADAAAARRCCLTARPAATFRAAVAAATFRAAAALATLARRRHMGDPSFLPGAATGRPNDAC